MGGLQAAQAATWQQVPPSSTCSRRAWLIPTDPCEPQGEDEGERHRDRRRHVERALALQALTSSVRVLQNLNEHTAASVSQCLL
jgi:hypothetical protein